MKNIFILLISSTLIWGCGPSKSTIERNQQLNDLTTFLKASEINRSGDIRQFKEIVLGLKSDMKKSDEKFTNLIDQNSSYTVEMTEGVKREMDDLQAQMGAITNKMKAMSSKLERLAKYRFYKKAVRKQVKNVQKPAIKTYVQPKMEPVMKPMVKKTVKAAPKPVVKKAEKPAVVVEAVRETPAKPAEPMIEKAMKPAPPVVEKAAKLIEPTSKPVAKPSSLKEVTKKEVNQDYPTNPGYNEFVQPTIEVVKPIKTKSGKLQIEE